ncbi:MAG: sigma-70 family RNA polymerase sigma factor [Acidobacteria bacterium]|nr:sigma-70 family RNA polymerase sigma factor [Acidobacteriota bacterium]
MDTARLMGVAVERALPATGYEAALVTELQAGSEEAFDYLVAVYQHPVFNLVSHIVEDGTEAADVLQEVFVKVFRGIRQFHGESSLKTWIYRIAVHEASNHRRGWWRRHLREAFSLDASRADADRFLADSPSRPETPYQALEQAERQKMVRRALASLAQPYRSVVVLREIEGLGYGEIAQVLGISEGTVKSRLIRGRELLKRKLTGWLRQQDV